MLPSWVMVAIIFAIAIVAVLAALADDWQVSTSADSPLESTEE